MAPATTLPIAQLQPGLDDPDSTTVTGIVTLIWPYSSSTQTLSFLLVEPDFRLRRHRGQVRVQFHGSSAKALSRSGVASGDQPLLSLKGVEWAKDIFIASTPGRGIDWELRYGERLVIQIPRANRETVSLDIDHPSPSPEPPLQGANPSQSPPYNSHIPTTIRAPNLASQAWASPAFLKRGHFSTSSYNPFVEADFPDNDRRKKTKFGRSSGEWRFSERTPSPDKKGDTSIFDMPSPSDMKSHYKMSDDAVIPAAQILQAEAAGNEQTASEISAEEPIKVTEVGPPSPPTTSAEPPEEIPENSVPEQSPPVVQSPSSASPQPASSSSVISGIEQDAVIQNEEEYQPNDSDIGMFSGPKSDFGLDGSVFSRGVQTSKATADTAEYKEGIEDPRFAEGDLTTARDMESFMPEEIRPFDSGRTGEDYLCTIKESMHQFLNFDGDDSEHVSILLENAQPAQQAPHFSSEYSEQLESEHAWVEVMPGEDAAASEEGSPRLTVGESSPKEVERATLGKAVDVEVTRFDRANGEEESEEDDERQEIDSEEEESQNEEESEENYSQGEEDSQHEEDSQKEEEMQERASQDDYTQGDRAFPGGSLEPKSSAVEIIDLESDDEEEQPVEPSSPKAGAPESTVADHGLIDSFPVQVDSAAMHPTNVPQLDEQGALEDRLSSPPVAENAKEVALRSTRAGQESLFKESTVGSQIPKVDTRSQSPELPSTVQDTYNDPSSKSQLMTPRDTQQSSFLSQPSFTSIQTAPGGETLPTPRLTQGTSAGIVPPETLQLPASQEPLEVQPSTVEKETTVIEKKTPTPQKPPNLIEKLKAMRRLSRESSRRSSDVSVASPWFAPKRSSQIVPDSEAGSEVESSSENDRSTKQDVTSTDQTPRKQNPSANSFNLKPSQRTTAASIASSPGYLPPSQPPPPGFRTNLSYFVPLATLLAHFTTIVDILAIAVGSTSVTRATSGPRDYNQTIYLTDPSSFSLQPPIRRAQIFRAYNKCFPVVERGDAIMLRDFRVQSFSRQMTLLSTQSSSWALFRKGAGVQVRGPPIEFGAEERLFARGMWRWWDGLKEEERAALSEAIPREEPNKGKTKDNKANGASKIANRKPNVDNSKSTIKKESIEDMGIELAGSQIKTRRASRRERSMDLDGAVDANKDKVLESTEPPKRVLRPRGARALPERSESPMKVSSTRYGTVFTSGLGGPESD